MVIFEILLIFLAIPTIHAGAETDAEIEFSLLPLPAGIAQTHCKCGRYNIAYMKMLVLKNKENVDMFVLISPNSIGKGTFAKVFHVVELNGTRIGNCAALKVPTEVIPGLAQRALNNEYQILKRLKNNQNEVIRNVEKSYGIFMYINRKGQSKEALALELGQESLETLWPQFVAKHAINHHGQYYVPENWILLILEQILNGINELHKNSIIHIDLKLNNIILFGKDTFKLIDFGGSEMANDEWMMTFDEFKNHPFSARNPPISYYWPPEMYRTALGYYMVTSKLDIWAFGTIGVELLLHNPIFFNKIDAWLDELGWSKPTHNIDILKTLFIAQLVSQVISGQLRDIDGESARVYWNDKHTRIGQEIANELESVYPNIMGWLKKCFIANNRSRPTAAELTADLNKMKLRVLFAKSMKSINF